MLLWKMIDSSQILTEPERKNTAPCIAYASAKIFDLNPNATLVVAPSDHLILKEDKFTHIVNIAIETAVRLEEIGVCDFLPED